MNINDYLEIQPARQLDKKKRHKNGFSENVQDTRKLRINFKNYMRQIEEDEHLLDVNVDDDEVDE
jgi:hypothetical protein